MKKIVAILMAMLMVMSVTVVLAGNAKDTQTDSKKVKVIIGFKEKPNQADEDTIRGLGGETRHTYNIIDAKAVEIPEQAIDRIKKNPRVAYVEEDVEVYALEETLPWGVDRIDAELVHPANKGTGVKVAIIDSGIDKDHPDLEANIKGGVNFVSTPPWKPADPDKWDDDNGHGTHCAGTVAAVDNEEGVIGVAPEAYLYGVKVLGKTGSGYVSDVIAGIDWSVTNNMQIISLSLGGGDLESMESACDEANNAGIVVVAAAGNSGPEDDTVIYPAKYESVIAVSATDNTDTIAAFSSRGPEVELAAPGVSILSTYPGGYATASGTSMACPHVAGTAALVIASGITDGNDNDWINDEVRARLQSTADDLGATGLDNWYGHGLVDADEAAPQPGDASPVVNIMNPADGSTVSGTITIEAAASDDVGVDTVDFYIDGTLLVTIAAPYSYAWDTTSVADGSHTIEATATDTVGQTASDSIGVTVDNTPQTNTMHVDSIDMSPDSRSAGKNTFVWAVATVTIVDESDSPVEGALVSGHWSDATTDSDSRITNVSGQVSLKSDSVKNPPPSGTTFTFTVDGVTHADLTWDGKSASGSITPQM